MGPPQPKTVMAASAKQVLRRLDNVDDRLKVFFEPAAKLVMADCDPEDALSRALAALSGLLEVPKPRRLGLLRFTRNPRNAEFSQSCTILGCQSECCK